MYPSLQTEDRRFQSEQGNNKRQEPASKINKPSEQPSDGEDDDNQDYRMLLKLNQNEVKNLILGSYFNKILSSNGFINDLEYILEFCQGGTRLPSYSKRTLLLFLEEVI